MLSAYPCGYTIPISIFVEISGKNTKKKGGGNTMPIEINYMTNCPTAPKVPIFRRLQKERE